jgi:hypothetical protein
MFRTDDNYNLYYDGAISEDQETAFQTLIAEHQLSPEFTELLKRHYNFRIKNSYDDHKKLLWIFYKVFGSFAITIFSAEEEHPHGCEYSDECNERIEKGSAGFEKDCKVRGKIGEMQLEPFVKSLTAG